MCVCVCVFMYIYLSNSKVMKVVDFDVSKFIRKRMAENSLYFIYRLNVNFKCTENYCIEFKNLFVEENIDRIQDNFFYRKPHFIPIVVVSLKKIQKKSNLNQSKICTVANSLGWSKRLLNTLLSKIATINALKIYVYSDQLFQDFSTSIRNK